MPEIHYDRYYRYDDLTRLLHAFAGEYPHLVRVGSIGQSYEGRDIWLATVTHFETGPAEDKPALWVDGNIHATELAPSSACLYLIDRLTREYGSDEDITHCLDTRAFYVCPRVNPDGAEWALAERPKLIRSSTRPYPFDEEPVEGLLQKDMDGDGRILSMRIPDPNGPWKPHPDEPRLMVRREPFETGGEYYWMFNEGELENYDGLLIKPQQVKEGLDLNRNFPANWRLEGEQKGAGPYPTSEPEARALAHFITGHRNITGGVAFHTWSGVILRPFDTKPDEEFAPEDLWTYKKIGEKGTELTGYPNVSVYHEFRYHPKEVITGGFDSWLFEHVGVFSWTVEIWSPQRQAGIEEYKYIDWYREHPVEDDLKMLKWSDEILEGKGYIDWYEFEHPQLGAVELGGWDFLHCWRNPPPQFLEQEIAPFADWLIWLALISPRLEVLDLSVTPLGDDNFCIKVAVQNTGWLPAYVTKQALEKKAVRGVICEIELPEGAVLTTGKVRQDIGQLQGRAYDSSSVTPWIFLTAETGSRARVEWVVYAPQGGTAKLTARHDRAGVVRAEVALE